MTQLLFHVVVSLAGVTALLGGAAFVLSRDKEAAFLGGVFFALISGATVLEGFIR